MTLRVLRTALTAVLATTLAAGCQNTPSEPRVVTQRVLVAQPVPCPALAALGEEPEYPDTNEAIANAPTVGALAQLYRLGRAMRDARLTEYMVARASCESLEEAE